jgi:hypothetical protein
MESELRKLSDVKMVQLTNWSYDEIGKLARAKCRIQKDNKKKTFVFQSKEMAFDLV